MRNYYLFFIAFSLFFISCEDTFQEEYATEVTYHNDPEMKRSPETRAFNIPNSTEYLPDILDQISDIPVNIIKIGNYGPRDYNFLSTHLKYKIADLWTVDDGKYTQRFYLKSSFIIGNPVRKYVVKMVNQPLCIYPGQNDVATLISDSKPGYPAPPPTGLIFEKKLSGYYNILHQPGLNADVRKQLQPKSNTSRDLIFSETQRDVQWEVTPVDKFELIGIRYFKYEEEGDYIYQTYRDYNTYNTDNLMNNQPIEITVAVDDEVTVNSQFIENDGFSMSDKITNSNSSKVDGPSFSRTNSLTTEFTMGSTYNATYSQSQTSKVTFKMSQVIVCPPYKYARIHVKLNFLTAKLTYYAMYKSANKVIYVKGKYTGVIGRDTETIPEFYDQFPAN